MALPHLSMGSERPATVVKVATDDDIPGAVEVVLEEDEEDSASEKGMVVLTVCACRAASSPLLASSRVSGERLSRTFVSYS